MATASGHDEADLLDYLTAWGLWEPFDNLPTGSGRHLGTRGPYRLVGTYSYRMVDSLGFEWDRFHDVAQAELALAAMNHLTDAVHGRTLRRLSAGGPVTEPDPADELDWLALADWLEEQGRVDEADGLRELHGLRFYGKSLHPKSLHTGVRTKSPHPYQEPEPPEHWEWSTRHSDFDSLTHRQQVLLAAHYARRVLYLWEEAYPHDPYPRRAIEAAERWARDPSHKNALAAANAREAAWESCDSRTVYGGAATLNAARGAARAAIYAAETVDYGSEDPQGAASAAVTHHIAGSAALRGGESGGDFGVSSWHSLHHARAPEGAALVQEWRTPEVENLARSIYDHEDWEGLPVLADALEDAGCSDQRILLPLRHGRNHSRASWALQQILHGGQG